MANAATECRCGHPANAHERGGVGRCINCGRHGKPGCGQFKVKP